MKLVDLLDKLAQNIKEGKEPTDGIFIKLAVNDLFEIDLNDTSDLILEQPDHEQLTARIKELEDQVAELLEASQRQTKSLSAKDRELEGLRLLVKLHQKEEPRPWDTTYRWDYNSPMWRLPYPVTSFTETVLQGEELNKVVKEYFENQKKKGFTV